MGRCDWFIPNGPHAAMLSYLPILKVITCFNEIALTSLSEHRLGKPDTATVYVLIFNYCHHR